MSINYGAHEQWYHSAISWLPSAEEWLSKQWPRRTAELNLVLQHHSLDLAACETLAEFFVWFAESLGKYAFCHIASIPAQTLSEYAFSWLQKWLPAWKIPISKIFPYLYFCFPLFIPLPSDLHYLSPSPSVPARNFHFLYTSSPTTWN